MPTRVLCAVLVCILLVAPAFCEQQEPQIPTIKRRSELVLVPVIFEPPPSRGSSFGLTARDFVLLVDGQQERIAEFEEILAKPAQLRQIILPPRTVQNFTSTDSHGDVVILLLDYLNAKSSSDAMIRSHFMAIVRELKTMKLSFIVLVLSQKGLALVHSFASDPEIFSNAVAQWIMEDPKKKANRDGTGSLVLPDWANVLVPMEAAQTVVALRQAAVLPDKVRKNVDYEQAGDLAQEAKTLRAIEQLAEAFRGISSRKMLIWLASDVRDYGSLAAARHSLLSLRDADLRSWKAMSDANIAVYPIVARRAALTEKCSIEVVHGVPFAPFGYKFIACTGCPNFRPSWLPAEVALASTGKVCDDVPGLCLVCALFHRYFFMLGFYLHGENKLGWHKVQVKVNRPGIVHAREGFFVYDGGALTDLRTIKNDVLANDSRDDDAVRVALSSPLDYTSIPLRLHWTPLNTTGNEPQVELVVSSPPGGIAADSDDMSLNIDFLAFFKPVGVKEGQPFSSKVRTMLNPEQQKTFATAGFRFRNVVTIAPGHYEVRVLVRDNVARKMGTVSTIIDLTTPVAPAKSEIRP